MKKILVITSASIHAKKFIEMMEQEYEVSVLTNNIAFFDGAVTQDVFVWQKSVIANTLFSIKLIRKIKPDLIHIHQVNKISFFYIFLFSHFYKILLTAWGSDILVAPHKGFISRWMTRFCLKNTTYLSSINSIGMEATMRSLVGNDKQIYPLSFGVSKYVYFPDPKEEKEHIIYSPRGHRKLYNIERVVYAFSRFVKKNTEWMLFISGASDEENTPRLKKLVEALGIGNNTQFLGELSQQENADMMRRAKVMISVPDSDGRPISVLEAISSNCTLICSNIGANREIVVEGVSGVFVNPAEDFDLSLVKDIDINLQTKFNQIISNDFSFEKAKKDYLLLLDDILI